MMRYVCSICGYIYDESKEKELFSHLPDLWQCPLCGASKAFFEPEKTEMPVVEKTISTEMKNTSNGLTSGQLASLFSNLARGFEKQYKEKEAKLALEIAAYFTSIKPVHSSVSIEELSVMLQKDIANYPAVRAIADDQDDRGAARVCVWGEKVTRMLSSLVDQYRQQGERMTADKNIWICSVCGFVYVGDLPPVLCPVCKVPEWKFEKIDRRP